MRERLAPSERVRIVINHQELDRPPIQFYATLEARLSSHRLWIDTFRLIFGRHSSVNFLRK